ncbi:hypothetical protein B0H13DRAFT_2471578 [Mycena leptocephala]|nr:hypothetical protein B0H13DRAFT_2471578 [Mycena leptocephala]
MQIGTEYYHTEYLQLFADLGGYAPSAPSQLDATDRTASMFTYYADTFVYGLDGTTGAAWKHVLTHGFPTYRAQSQFMADPATGRTFLFGGYVSAEYVPARGDGVSQCFSDLVLGCFCIESHLAC